MLLGLRQPVLSQYPTLGAFVEIDHDVSEIRVPEMAVIGELRSACHGLDDGAHAPAEFGVHEIFGGEIEGAENR